MGKALTSVCMTTYNGERYVEAQVHSILQSGLVDELLVSDDGSSDRTLTILHGISDSRLRVLTGPCRGLVRNFEFVLGEARGDCIFLADQDDVWLPDKVAEMLAALRHSDLVLSDCTVVDAQLHTIDPSFFSSNGSRPGLLRNLAKNSYIGCCMAVRKTLLAHALPFPPSVPMHDWWLGVVAETFGSVSFLPTPLLLYRRHGANASSTSGQSAAGLGTRLLWRYTLCLQLLLRWTTARGSAATDASR